MAFLWPASAPCFAIGHASVASTKWLHENVPALVEDLFGLFDEWTKPRRTFKEVAEEIVEELKKKETYDSPGVVGESSCELDDEDEDDPLKDFR